MANRLVFKKIQGMLGLDECKYVSVGAAPLHPETLEFFMGLNLPLKEGYGMTECTGPHTTSSDEQWRIGSCGKTIDGADTKIDNPDQYGNGEVSMSCWYISSSLIWKRTSLHGIFWVGYNC